MICHLEFTFERDLKIAEMFGPSAVRDTYKRCMRDWKSNARALAELCIALNGRLWATYNAGNMGAAHLYDDLWRKACDYARVHLKGDDLRTWYELTD